jgi:hypothetical protein
VRIQEPTIREKYWFSHKFHGPGLRYEIAVSLKKGHIVWISGPHPCGIPDIEIFRHCLKHELEENERVEADDGYVGEDPETCRTPGGISGRSERIDPLVGGEPRRRLRSRHETANKRCKDFRILRDEYRHNVYEHAFVFRAVAVLVQISLENREPLFKL